MSFWGRIWLQINKCCRKSPFPNGNVATRWSCQTDLRHPTLPLGARGHTQGLVTGDKHPFPGSSGSKSLRFQGALKVGLRCLLRSADPACNTAATCRPCRPAASTRTLQACSPAASLAARSVSCRQACRTLQQPAGQQRLWATCRPWRPPYRPYSKPAKPAACLPLHGFQSSITWAFSCIHTESISPCKHKGFEGSRVCRKLESP